MDEYQKLQQKRFPRRGAEAPEAKWWRRFATSLAVKQVGAITDIDFCPTSPHNIAVSSSTRVLTYNGETHALERQITRFKDKAYSGCYRDDGKLLAAGGEMGVVQVFDTASRTLLRRLEGHSKPVHFTKFATDNVHILSGGDDAAVRWWDISEGAQVLRMDGHRDYIRAGARSPSTMDTWATGGYDHVCRLWDVRAGRSTMELDHGAPVEDVVFLPSGTLLATAGGPYICIWDVLASGQLLRRLTNHQKTVTSLAVGPSAGPEEQPRLISASLDQHVKVYELDTFKVTHATLYGGPILSLGISPKCDVLAVGMADGTLAVRKKVVHANQGESVGSKDVHQKLTLRNYKSSLSGQAASLRAGDYLVPKKRKIKLPEYEKMLKKFRYRDALDAALKRNNKEIVQAMLEELVMRGGLVRALKSRELSTLGPLLSYVKDNIAHPDCSRLLLGVTSVVLDIYGPMVGADKSIDTLMEAIMHVVQGEVEAEAALRDVQGCLDPILAARFRTRE
eukprot:evm.model.scf_1585.1 EVM.evm.TU.scf_1585.1   scf_1585:22260-29819(-)